MTDKINSFIDLIIQAREEAIERGIQANSIVISDKLRYVKSFRLIDKFSDGGISMKTFKPMICGMEIDVKKLPANLDFVVYEADETFNEKLKAQIRKDTAKEILRELFDDAKEMAKDKNYDFAIAYIRMKTILRFKAKEYGVEVD